VSKKLIVEKIERSMYEIKIKDYFFILQKGVFTIVDDELRSSFEKIKSNGWTLHIECFVKHFQTKKAAIKWVEEMQGFISESEGVK